MNSRGWILCTAVFLACALVFSYPLVLHMRESMPYSFIPVKGQEIVHQHPGDYIQLFYRFWLFCQAITGKIPFLCNPYEFSTPGTPPLFTTQGVPLSFIFLLFTPLGTIFAYNALVLLSFLAAGLALALLLKEFTGSLPAAISCGALYACFPYRLGHLYGGHPGGFVFFLTPLSLYLFRRAWLTGGGNGTAQPLLWGMASGLCVFTAALTDLHTAFYLGLFLGALLILTLADSIAGKGIRETARIAPLPLIGLGIVLAAAMLYLIWVKYFFLETSIVRGGRAIETVRSFSPQLRDLFRKSPNAESNVYMGVLPLLLAVYGFFSRRGDIRHGRGEPGALLWLYFWAILFLVSSLLSLGTALEPYLPIYSWLHDRIPFLAYSRTPSRAMVVAVVCLFVLAAYGLRALFRKGGLVKGAAYAAVALSLLDYHPRAPVGISLMRGTDLVYETVRDKSGEGRLLELPLWPGDSAWSAIYEYYVTLTGVPMINGYNPAVQRAYVTRVFVPLRDLNLGEMRPRQHELLTRWDTRYAVLHQEAFPHKVSRYPFRLTLLKLLDSPYLEYVRRDGPHHLFRIRSAPVGPNQDFGRASPVGNVYPSHKMSHDTGALVNDGSSSSGTALHAAPPTAGPGALWRGHSRIYPTGAFRVFFNLKTDGTAGRVPVTRLEVYAPEKGEVLEERTLTPRDFTRPHTYELFEIGFAISEPTRVEFRINYGGEGSLWADFVYVIFEGERDPRAFYEAEDLFHIGSCVEDRGASDGLAVHVGKDEDIHMPVINGPSRLYGPGSYRARCRLRAAGLEQGDAVQFEVASSFGGTVAARSIAAGDMPDSEGYRAYDISFELKKTTPLSFRLRHFNRALIWVDRIDILSLNVP